jgi:hypothetical protein
MAVAGQYDILTHFSASNELGQLALGFGHRYLHEITLLKPPKIMDQLMVQNQACSAAKSKKRCSVDPLLPANALHPENAAAYPAVVHGEVTPASSHE